MSKYEKFHMHTYRNIQRETLIFRKRLCDIGAGCMVMYIYFCG